ncbi:MAG TPA: copper chaperone PCu(A)C [Xanthobacteraceae bacterium]|jgi:copper(I)-binding protein|nr:copper chaperone PCu(A)C [Xanthobacteraceae bacterium]
MNFRATIHALSAIAVVLCVASASAAETFTVGSIEVTGPWARATPKGASVGGAYMTVTNKGSEPDRLTGGSSPAAAKLEVHQMSMNNGVMSMRPVQGGLEIKPGQTVVFNPSSFHIMMVGLKQPLTQGEHVKATLDFAKAGKLDVEYVVESIGAQGPSAASTAPAMPGMDHGTMGNMGGSMGNMNHAH